MAAEAVLPGAEACPGHGGCRGFTDRAACALQMARCHSVCTHQRGRELAGVVRQVNVYGCCGDDTGCGVRDSHVCIERKKKRVLHFVSIYMSVKQKGNIYAHHCWAHCNTG